MVVLWNLICGARRWLIPGRSGKMVWSLDFSARYARTKLKSLIREFHRTMACARACHQVARQLPKNGKLLISLPFLENYSCPKIVVQKWKTKYLYFSTRKKYGKKWITICGYPRVSQSCTPFSNTGEQQKTNDNRLNRCGVPYAQWSIRLWEVSLWFLSLCLIVWLKEYYAIVNFLGRESSFPWKTNPRSSAEYTFCSGSLLNEFH
jgi:hypothetical protein